MKKETKEITVLAHAYTPECTEGHNWWLGKVTEEQLRRIERLSAFVRREKLYCVEYFSLAGKLFDELPTTAETVDILVDDNENYNEEELQEDQEPSAPDTMTCVVTDLQVYWRWPPRHSDRNEYCETELIGIKNLRKLFQRTKGKK